MTQIDLVQKLKDYAERRHISHSRFAKMLGVNPNTLGQWLQGHRKLRKDECDRVENFFKTNK